MQLDNVRLLVENFEPTFRFYRDALGLRVTWGEPTGNYASFACTTGSGINLFRRQLMSDALGTANLPAKAAAQDRFALILRVDGIDAFVAALPPSARPLSPPRDMTEWGIRTCHLRDPDGNLIELYQDLPKEAWSDRLKADDARLKK